MCNSHEAISGLRHSQHANHVGWIGIRDGHRRSVMKNLPRGQVAVRTNCQDRGLLDIWSAEPNGIRWNPCLAQLADGPLFLRKKVEGDWPNSTMTEAKDFKNRLGSVCEVLHSRQNPTPSCDLQNDSVTCRG